MDENPYRAPRENGEQRSAAWWRILLACALLLQGIFLAVTVTVALHHLTWTAPMPQGLAWSSIVAVEVGMIVTTIWAYARKYRQAKRSGG